MEVMNPRGCDILLWRAPPLPARPPAFMRASRRTVLPLDALIRRRNGAKLGLAADTMGVKCIRIPGAHSGTHRMRFAALPGPRSAPPPTHPPCSDSNKPGNVTGFHIWRIPRETNSAADLFANPSHFSAASGPRHHRARIKCRRCILRGARGAFN